MLRETFDGPHEPSRTVPELAVESMCSADGSVRMLTIARSLGSPRSPRKLFGLQQTRRFVDRVFGDDLHAQRVASLGNGVVGVLTAAVLSIHAIGRAYAHVAGISAKGGIKQIDRMLSNGGLDLDVIQAAWVRFVVGNVPQLTIALDWTDFEKDDHTTLCAYLVTRHGRALPLAWRTVKKSELKDRQTQIEMKLIRDLGLWIPGSVRITLLADRGFGKQELYEELEALHWDFIIRFRGDILVESAAGDLRPAADWVPSNGRAMMLAGARVTGKKKPVAAVVVVKAKRMKEPWCLATSLASAQAQQIVRAYGRRFSIEETFRDTKDLHFGMGLSATHIRNADRRDRLLLLVAAAYTLLTLLGQAGEESGLDRYLKANTVKHRTLSLFRQGHSWYHAIPNMRDEWLERLMTAFDRIVREHPFFSILFAPE